ncbi:hypothetical protein RFI_16323, partial [Reticulomyxa filosa]
PVGLSRKLITYYIVRMLLRVLTIGMDEYSKTNLKIRHRSGEILTCYQDRIAEEEKAQGNYNKTDQKYRLDYGFQGHMDEKKSEDSSAASDIKKADASGKPTISRGQVERRADLAASLLVDIIGVDSRPIIPFFPVLVLYASIFISISSNPRQLRHLLVRMMSTLCLAKDLTSLQNEQINYEQVSVATALKSRDLQLVWEQQQRQQQFQAFTIDRAGKVAMDGAVFVDKYCQVLMPELKAKDRIGYEALRWAVLSTNQDISQRAFHVYRQLLNPLNHAAVKVMLLALVGAIDQWDNATKFQNNKQAIPKEHFECLRVLETLLKMASTLRLQQKLHEYPALFWAGIALMRANARNDHESLLFEKGLLFLSIYLFIYLLFVLFGLFICVSSLELVGINLDQSHNPQYFIETNVQEIVPAKLREVPSTKNNASQSGTRDDTSTKLTANININTNTNTNTNINTNTNSNVIQLPELLKKTSPNTSKNKTKEKEDDEEEIIFISISEQRPAVVQNDSENAKNTTLKLQRYTSMSQDDSELDVSLSPYTTPMDEVDVDGTLIFRIPMTIAKWKPFQWICKSKWKWRCKRREMDYLQSVQQYLLQGFLRAQHEDLCFKIIKDALIVKMDNIIDRTNLRPLLALIAVLPYLCYHSRHSPQKLTSMTTLFRRLKDALAPFSKKLGHKLQEHIPSKGVPIIKDEEAFLKDIAPILVEYFFDSYAKVIANFFEGLLESPGMEHYHAIIFKITRYLLEYGAGYLLCFEKIIAKAHKVVSGGILPRNLSDNATDLVKVAIEHIKSNKDQKSPHNLIDVSPFPEVGLKFRHFFYLFACLFCRWRKRHNQSHKPLFF